MLGLAPRQLTKSFEVSLKSVIAAFVFLAFFLSRAGAALAQGGSDLRLLSYDEVMALNKSHRLAYLRALEAILIDLEELETSREPAQSFNDLGPRRRGSLVEILHQLSSLRAESAWATEVPSVSSCPTLYNSEVIPPDPQNPSKRVCFLHNAFFIPQITNNSKNFKEGACPEGHRAVAQPLSAQTGKALISFRLKCELVDESKAVQVGAKPLPNFPFDPKRDAKIIKAMKDLEAQQKEKQIAFTKRQVALGLFALPGKFINPLPQSQILSASEPKGKNAMLDSEAKPLAAAAPEGVRLPLANPVADFSCIPKECKNDEADPGLLNGFAERSETRCINGMQITKFDSARKKCPFVGSLTIGNLKLRCKPTETMCWPLLVGLRKNHQPLCVRRSNTTTRECSDLANRLPKDDLIDILDDRGNKEALRKAWDDWTRDLTQLCSVNEASVKYHCRECAAIKKHLIALQNTHPDIQTVCGDRQGTNFKSYPRKKVQGTQ